MQATYFNNRPQSRGRPKSAATGRQGVSAYTGAALTGVAAKTQAGIDARRRLVLNTPSDRFAAARALRAHAPHIPIQRSDNHVPVPVKTRLAFEAFDRNHSGHLDYRELKNAMRHYGFDVTARESARVLSAYDDHPNGKLDIAEFARLVKDLQNGLLRANAAPSYDYQQLPERTRHAFRKFDSNRSGYLDYRELRGALKAYGLDATARGAARILAAYDHNPDGKLDIAEFARIVADLDSGQIASTRETVPERARKAFLAFDSDRDGQIDYRELRHALKYYGFDVTADQSAKVLEAYDDRPNRRLDLVEFSNLVQDLELGVLRSDRPQTPSAHAKNLPQRAPPDRPLTASAKPPSAGPDQPIDTLAGGGGSPAFSDPRGALGDDDDFGSAGHLHSRARRHAHQANAYLREQLKQERAIRLEVRDLPIAPTFHGLLSPSHTPLDRHRAALLHLRLL